jgi:hypothetical protein
VEASKGEKGTMTDYDRLSDEEIETVLRKDALPGFVIRRAFRELQERREAEKAGVIPFEWEEVCSGGDGDVGSQTSRSRVPGGWALLYTTWGPRTKSTAMAFVPDPRHEWKIEEVKDV